MASKEKTRVVGYLRTSSSTNVGSDKDSEKRQRTAIEAFAKSAGYSVAASFYDAAVSGADHIADRPGFSQMLEWMSANGVKTVIVETASRFARDILVQELGHDMLKKCGITLIAADSPDAFVSDSPTSKLIRTILGGVSEFEKAMLVSKLKGARERRKAEAGKCGGRKSHKEVNAVMVATAKRLRRYRANGRQRSLRQISAELARLGFLNANGRPFAAASIRAMIASR